jgi:hypothetical protein
MRGPICGGRRAIGAAMIVGWLLLAACAQTGSQPSSGANDPNAPVSNTDASVPPDPNQPVTGFPGQPGAPATGAAVEGRVTDAAGQPVAGVLVIPQSTDSPPQPIPEIAALTNEQGRYQWSLPPGAYTLTFSREGYASTSAPVTIVQGRSATLDVTLQQP